MPIETEILTQYLEMSSPQKLLPATKTGLQVVEIDRPSPELSRFFYTAVGGDWYWLDRLPWTYERWRQHLEQDGITVWVGYSGSSPAGYFELDRQPSAEVEIAYFGLLPGFVGQGHGGYLLTRAVEEAWNLGARRVWLHTCSLDGPHALANYRARGFEVYRRETTRRLLPDAPPGPWPGARGGQGEASAS